MTADMEWLTSTELAQKITTWEFAIHLNDEISVDNRSSGQAHGTPTMLLNAMDYVALRKGMREHR